MVQREAGRVLVGELVDQRIATRMHDEVSSSYRDVWGKERAIDAAVRAALLKAMGPARRGRKFAAVPGRCYQPEVLEQRRRSEEHTSELQSPTNLVCRLLLE